MDKDNSRGSLTVEMVLILVPFMLCFMTLLNISRVVQAEVIIHHAITQTAKEISAYSYVLTKTGISDRMVAQNGKSAKFKADINQVVEDLTDIGSTIGDLGSSFDVEGQLNAIQSDIDSIDAVTSPYVDNPKMIAAGVIAALKSDGRGYAMKTIAGKLAKGSIKKQLALVTENPDLYLENIGVVDGLEGLRFNDTHYLDATGGKGEIKVVVTFTMKNNIFPMFDFGEHSMRLCASTLLW